MDGDETAQTIKIVTTENIFFIESLSSCQSREIIAIQIKIYNKKG